MKIYTCPCQKVPDSQKAIWTWWNTLTTTSLSAVKLRQLDFNFKHWHFHLSLFSCFKNYDVVVTFSDFLQFRRVIHIFNTKYGIERTVAWSTQPMTDRRKTLWHSADEPWPEHKWCSAHTNDVSTPFIIAKHHYINLKGTSLSKKLATYRWNKPKKNQGKPKTLQPPLQLHWTISNYQKLRWSSKRK